MVEYGKKVHNCNFMVSHESANQLNTCKGFLSLQNGLSVWFTWLHNLGEDCSSDSCPEDNHWHPSQGMDWGIFMLPCRLAVGGLPVRSHPGRVEVSLSKTPNPQLLLTSWLVPCMAANCRWCVNVCVNGWMRGINCKALWIKALYKCSPKVTRVNFFTIF